MATYPPISADRRVAQHISYSSEAATILPGSSAEFSSNLTRGESPLNFGGSPQFIIHSMAGNSNDFEPAHQGCLSLSLATRAVNSVVHFHDEPSILGCSNNGANGEDKDAAAGGNSNYTSYMGRTDVESMYLKAAQELLEEVVSVKKESTFNAKSNVRTFETMENDGLKVDNICEPTDANLRDLSSGEKQELQDKLTKLLWMLDEVDRRYRQYYHQMHVVVSSFDAISGSGSAKPYTSLALQTISRHFRALRDAINGQISRARKNLGGEDYSPCSNDKGGVGISRLRYVDQQIRQQRALQQLGMMQPHTWRPQRGLPEASVTILRAWLFEHFLHPYPKDSDKVMLARQTGLTRSQVSNWFINARVRLWKPMIEEMYREEEAKGIGDADVDSNSSSDNNIVPCTTTTAATTTTTTDKPITREDHRLIQQNTTPHSSSSSARAIDGSDGFNNPVFHDSSQAGPSNCGGYYVVDQQNESVGIFPGAILQPNDGHRFFGNAGGIILTLGLQQDVNMVNEGFVPPRGNSGVSDDAYGAPSFGYGGS